MVGKKHVKRYLMPAFWPVKLKEYSWTVKPRPGPHQACFSIPLVILIRDFLKLAKTSKEAGRAIKAGKIVVDKKPRKDPRFSVGLMDVVEIPSIHKQYRVIATAKGLGLNEISVGEADKKVCKITGKTTIKGGVFQLNLHDGRNILTEKTDYKVGDSLLLNVADQKILGHYTLEEDVPAAIFGGNNMGHEGVITNLYKRKRMVERNKAKLNVAGHEVETLVDYIIATGPKGSVEKKHAAKSEDAENAVNEEKVVKAKKPKTKKAAVE